MPNRTSQHIIMQHYQRLTHTLAHIISLRYTSQNINKVKRTVYLCVPKTVPRERKSMATFQKRGSRWRALIRSRGVTRSKTFATKAAAKSWANDEEKLILDGDRGQLPDHPFSKLLYRYNEDVSQRSGKKSADWELQRIEYLDNHYDLAKIPLNKLNDTHVIRWRDERLKQVSPDTVRREWTVFSAACNHAIREWKWLKINPFTIAKRPSPSPERTRRPTEDEIEAIVIASGYSPEELPVTETARVGAAFLFAIETAMRSGEMLRFTKENIKGKYIRLPGEITKSGKPRDVPLSKKAREILQQLLEVGHDPVFGVNDANRDALFRKIKGMALIEDLHFHDSRTEALTRLAKIFDVHELAKISGHRDLRILLNTYYQPTGDDLANKLD